MARVELDAGRDADAIEDILLDRPMASLYDVAYLYGKLHTLNAIRAYDVPASDRHVEHMTHESRTDYYDQEVGLVSVLVDLSGKEPSFGRANETGDTQGDSKFVAESLDREKMLRVGFSRQPSRTSGHNMSIAHDASDKAPGGTPRYFKKMFSSWAQSDSATEVAEEHPEGWVLERLAQIGSDTDLIDQLDDAEDFVRQTFGESFSGVVSLKLKLSETGDYVYPGEVDAINEVTRCRWIVKQMREYSEAADSSGESQGIVLDEEGEVEELRSPSQVDPDGPSKVFESRFNSSR